MGSWSSARRALPVALVLVLAAPVVTGAEMNPATTLAVGAFAGVALCAIAAWAGRHRLRRSTLLALASGGALAGWLTIAALLSADRSVSFMGTVSQHTGAAFWLLVSAWTVAAALLAERNTLRQLLAIVGATGAAFAVMGIAEAFTSGDRAWGSAAGPFENSTSLGAYLAVALFAAVGWRLSTRRTPEKRFSIACAVLCAAGIASAESRAGVVGALVGAVVIAVLWLAPRYRGQRAAAAVGLPLAGLGAATLLVGAALGTLGSSAARVVASLGTSRDAIWRSAAAQFEQSPLLGSGPELFSSWVDWSFRDGMLQYTGTYDPHNAVLSLALGGGVVALVLWALFAGATTWAQFGVYDRTGRPKVLIPIIAIPSVLMASTLFSWIPPAAGIAVAVLTGALFASDVREDAPHDPAFEADAPVTHPAAPVDPAVARGLAVALAAACVVVAALAIPVFSAEWRFTGTPAPGTVEGYTAMYRRWPDPAYAVSAIDAALANGADEAAVSAALAVPDAHAAYHVDLALRELFIAQVAVTEDPATWQPFADAVEAGVKADPASPLWYTVAAAQADAMGRIEDRNRYAMLALALKPGAEEQAYLDSLLAQ